MSDYKTTLVSRFREYRRTHFGNADAFFDRGSTATERPPVFKKEHASRNVLRKAGSPEEDLCKVLAAIPPEKRHEWFGSMASSQALAQSVFGNLIIYGKLGLLDALAGDDGKPFFFSHTAAKRYCELEAEVDYLGEKPRGRTSIDVFFKGEYRIAVECKLSEEDVGLCSRPELKPVDRSYCDGTYSPQLGRRDRCSLTASGVKYWTYIPQLFDWPADRDHFPCPVHSTYQLVRNILAACVRNGEVQLDAGHVVLIYDERNPAFQEDGDGMKAWQTVRAALKSPSLMQRCSWQQVVRCLRNKHEMDWLTSALAEKYGF